MKASGFEEPSYEEYWPNIDGLARRDQVTEEAMPSKTFFDIAVIHILTTSTINRLRELYPEGRFEVRRFRPNIVVESLDVFSKATYVFYYISYIRFYTIM